MCRARRARPSSLTRSRVRSSFTVQFFAPNKPGTFQTSGALVLDRIHLPVLWILFSARSCVEVARLPKDVLVEVEASFLIFALSCLVAELIAYMIDRSSLLPLRLKSP